MNESMDKKKDMFYPMKGPLDKISITFYPLLYPLGTMIFRIKKRDRFYNGLCLFVVKQRYLWLVLDGSEKFVGDSKHI